MGIFSDIMTAIASPFGKMINALSEHGWYQNFSRGAAYQASGRALGTQVILGKEEPALRALDINREVLQGNSFNRQAVEKKREEDYKLRLTQSYFTGLDGLSSGDRLKWTRSREAKGKGTTDEDFKNQQFWQIAGKTAPVTDDPKQSKLWADANQASLDSERDPENDSKWIKWQQARDTYMAYMATKHDLDKHSELKEKNALSMFDQNSEGSDEDYIKQGSDKASIRQGALTYLEKLADNSEEVMNDYVALRQQSQQDQADAVQAVDDYLSETSALYKFYKNDDKGKLTFNQKLKEYAKLHFYMSFLDADQVTRITQHEQQNKIAAKQTLLEKAGKTLWGFGCDASSTFFRILGMTAGLIHLDDNIAEFSNEYLHTHMQINNDDGIIDNALTRWADAIMETGSYNADRQAYLQKIGMSDMALLSSQEDQTSLLSLNTPFELLQQYGFTVGSMIASFGLSSIGTGMTKGTAKAAAALMKYGSKAVGVNSKAAKVAAKVTHTMEALNKIKANKAFAKFAKLRSAASLDAIDNINKAGFYSQFVVPSITAMSEAGMEATSTKRDLIESLSKQAMDRLNQDNPKMIEDLQAQVKADLDALTPDQLEEYMENQGYMMLGDDKTADDAYKELISDDQYMLNRLSKYNNAALNIKNEIHDEAQTAMYTNFVFNTAINGAIHYAYQRGLNSAIVQKSIGRVSSKVKGGINKVFGTHLGQKPRVHMTGTHADENMSRMQAAWQISKGRLKESWGEGLEEWHQDIANAFATGVQNSAFADYMDHRWGQSGVSHAVLGDLAHYFSAGFNNAIDTATSFEAIRDGLYGGLSMIQGGINMKRNKEGKLRPTWRSAFGPMYQEAMYQLTGKERFNKNYINEAIQEHQNIADYINKATRDQKSLRMLTSISGTFQAAIAADEAAEEGDHAKAMDARAEGMSHLAGILEAAKGTGFARDAQKSIESRAGYNEANLSDQNSEESKAVHEWKQNRDNQEQLEEMARNNKPEDVDKQILQAIKNDAQDFLTIQKETNQEREKVEEQFAIYNKGAKTDLDTIDALTWSRVLMRRHQRQIDDFDNYDAKGEKNGDKKKNSTGIAMAAEEAVGRYTKNMQDSSIGTTQGERSLIALYGNTKDARQKAIRDMDSQQQELEKERNRYISQLHQYSIETNKSKTKFKDRANKKDKAARAQSEWQEINDLQAKIKEANYALEELQTKRNALIQYTQTTQQTVASNEHIQGEQQAVVQDMDNRVLSAQEIISMEDKEAQQEILTANAERYSEEQQREIAKVKMALDAGFDKGAYKGLNGYLAALKARNAAQASLSQEIQFNRLAQRSPQMAALYTGAYKYDVAQHLLAGRYDYLRRMGNDESTSPVSYAAEVQKQLAKATTEEEAMAIERQVRKTRLGRNLLEVEHDIAEVTNTVDDAFSRADEGQQVPRVADFKRKWGNALYTTDLQTGEQIVDPEGGRKCIQLCGLALSFIKNHLISQENPMAVADLTRDGILEGLEAKYPDGKGNILSFGGYLHQYNESVDPSERVPEGLTNETMAEMLGDFLEIYQDVHEFQQTQQNSEVHRDDNPIDDESNSDEDNSDEDNSSDDSQDDSPSSPTGEEDNPPTQEEPHAQPQQGLFQPEIENNDAVQKAKSDTQNPLLWGGVARIIEVLNSTNNDVLSEDQKNMVVSVLASTDYTSAKSLADIYNLIIATANSFIANTNMMSSEEALDMEQAMKWVIDHVQQVLQVQNSVNSGLAQIDNTGKTTSLHPGQPVNPSGSIMDTLCLPALLRMFKNSVNSKFISEHRIIEALEKLSQDENLTSKQVVFLNIPELNEQVKNDMGEGYDASKASPLVPAIKLENPTEEERSSAVVVNGEFYQPLGLMPSTTSTGDNGAAHTGLLRQFAANGDQSKNTVIVDQHGNPVTTHFTESGVVKSKPVFTEDVDLLEQAKSENEHVTPREIANHIVFKNGRFVFVTASQREIPLQIKTMDRLNLANGKTLQQTIADGNLEEAKQSSFVTRFISRLQNLVNDSFGKGIELTDPNKEALEEKLNKALSHIFNLPVFIMKDGAVVPCQYKYKITEIEEEDGTIQYGLSLVDTSGNHAPTIELGAITNYENNDAIASNAPSEEQLFEVLKNMVVDENGDFRNRVTGNNNSAPFLRPQVNANSLGSSKTANKEGVKSTSSDMLAAINEGIFDTFEGNTVGVMGASFESVFQSPNPPSPPIPSGSNENNDPENNDPQEDEPLTGSNQEAVKKGKREAAQIAERIKRDSDALQLENNDHNSPFYVNGTGEKYVRVTGLEEGVEGVDQFDENSAWTTPSTAIGNNMDAFLRDLFEGSLDGKTPQQLTDKYHLSGEALNRLFTAINNWKTGMEALGYTFISHGVKAQGEVEVVMKTDPNHNAVEVKKIKTAGTLDLMAYKVDPKTGKVTWHIFDFKTHRSSNIRESAIRKWNVQLSLYKKLLETKYGIEVETVAIIPIHVNYEQPQAVSEAYKTLPTEISDKQMFEKSDEGKYIVYNRANGTLLVSLDNGNTITKIASNSMTGNKAFREALDKALEETHDLDAAYKKAVAEISKESAYHIDNPESNEPQELKLGRDEKYSSTRVSPEVHNQFRDASGNSKLILSSDDSQTPIQETSPAVQYSRLKEVYKKFIDGEIDGVRGGTSGTTEEAVKELKKNLRRDSRSPKDPNYQFGRVDASAVSDPDVRTLIQEGRLEEVQKKCVEKVPESLEQQGFTQEDWDKMSDKQKWNVLTTVLDTKEAIEHILSCNA